MNILRRVFSRTSNTPTASTQKSQDEASLRGGIEQGTASSPKLSNNPAPNTSGFISIWGRRMEQADRTGSSKFIAAFKVFGEQLGLIASTDISNKISIKSNDLIKEGLLKNPKDVLNKIHSFQVSSPEDYAVKGAQGGQFTRIKDIKRFNTILREIDECPQETKILLLNESKSHLKNISTWFKDSNFQYQVEALKESLINFTQVKLNYNDVENFQPKSFSDSKKCDELKLKLDSVLEYMKNSKFTNHEKKEFIKNFLLKLNDHPQKGFLKENSKEFHSLHSILDVINKHEPKILKEILDSMRQEKYIALWRT